MLTAAEIRTIRRNGWRRRKLIRHRLVDRHPFCFYCARPMTRVDSTLDHVCPLAAGGLDSESNFVVACRQCNRRKSNHGFELLACSIVRGSGLHMVAHVRKWNERFALNPNWKKRRR